jgi:hypothetical protein
MEDLVMDAARRRLQAETCVRVEKIKAAIELRDFVIIQACAEVEEPFHVAVVPILPYYYVGSQNLQQLLKMTFVI